jgi:nicotinate-nucleotide pyrophosphorylase (carboxylating)
VVRESAVICGTAWFDAAFQQLDRSVDVHWNIADGDRVPASAELCRIEGPARALLTGERTALNFLQTLSGTATATRALADLIADTSCRILDTRKTVPGLRRAQKYAVVCGGGTNHRTGLFDGILIKENHIAAAGSIAAAVTAARHSSHGVMVEVEVESLDELQQALLAAPDRIMVDEFPLDQLRTAVELTRNHSGERIELEASGNVTQATLPAIAATGVDYVSVGAITKHVRAVDLSMRLLEPEVRD